MMKAAGMFHLPQTVRNLSDIGDSTRHLRRGVSIVWVAIMGVLLITLVGLAMDAGVVYLAGTHLQVAADAASLAGAAVVRDEDPASPGTSPARAAAVAIAFENRALRTPVAVDPNVDNAAEGEVVIGRYHRFANSFCGTPPCFFPQTESPNAVRVRTRRTSASSHTQVPLVFGAVPMIDVTGVDVSRMATAMISGGTGAGLITLDPSGDCSLELGGDVIIDLTSAPDWDGDTAVQVNSDDPCALCGNGNFVLSAPETNIVGMDPGYCFSGSSSTVETYLNPDSPSMPDPLAYLAAPPIGPDRGAINPSSDAETYYEPGYYSGGMKISGQRKVRLGSASPGPGTPGIYIFEGTDNGSQGGFQTTGGASVIATNVMIYMKSGKLDLGGSGQTTITPMTEDVYSNSDYIGVAIFQARDNLTEARIIGTSNMNLEGTYYFPNNRLEVGGTGIALGNQLIAWQLYLHGTGEFVVQYDGRFPSPGSKVFLVD